MRHSPELLARVIGQMDSADEAVRLTAFSKAHAMLTAAGLTFSGVLSVPAGDDRQVAPEAVERPIVGSGPYIHDRLAGVFKKTYKGKRVLRGIHPPSGIHGRLRVLKDQPAFGPYSETRRLVLSFETVHELYEPFEVLRGDRDYLAALTESSTNGSLLSFA